MSIKKERNIKVSIVKDEDVINSRNQVTRSAGVVSLAVLGSRFLGLIREQTFAYYFGAGFLYDAYQVAFTIPNILRDLFAEGALSAAFVKVFTDYQIKESENEAWQLASLVFNVLVIILSVITILGVLFTPQIVGLIAGGFSTEKAKLTVVMTQIMFPFILLVAMAALAMGVLNTKGVFGIPASASTVFNIVSTTSGLLLAYLLSGGQMAGRYDAKTTPDILSQWAIVGMALGTLIGGAAQFLMQLPSLWKVGFRFSPILNLRDEGLKQVIRLMIPAVLGTSAVQINVMVNTFFVSEINGGRSWLSYAFRLMQFPIGIFGVAVGTASIPVLARLASQGRLDDFRQTLSSSLKLVFFLTIPSTCGLILLGEPIVRLLYQWGAFSSSSTSMVTWALIGYSIGLAGYAAIKILSPAFYALNDVKTPMIVAVVSILVNVVASYFFGYLFSNFEVTSEHPNGLAHVGVALATSSVSLVNFIALIYVMRLRLKRIEGKALLYFLHRVFWASVALSITSYFSYILLKSFMGTNGLLVRVLEVIIPVGLGCLTFLTAAKILKIEELNLIVNAVATRFLSKS